MLYTLSPKLAAPLYLPYESEQESVEFFIRCLLLWTDTWVCGYCPIRHSGRL